MPGIVSQTCQITELPPATGFGGRSPELTPSTSLGRDSAESLDVVSVCRRARRLCQSDRMSNIYWKFLWTSTALPKSVPLSKTILDELSDVQSLVVWNVSTTDVPTDPEVPPQFHQLFEAANTCHAVSYCAGLVLATRLRRQRLVVRSASLGVCQVVRVFVMKGFWKGKLCNPLINFVDVPSGELDITLLKEKAILEDGTTAYHHVWFCLEVKTPKGQIRDLYLDPTAAQLGKKDVVTWHADNPAPGGDYLARERLDTGTSEFEARVVGFIKSHEGKSNDFAANLQLDSYRF